MELTGQADPLQMRVTPLVPLPNLLNAIEQTARHVALTEDAVAAVAARNTLDLPDLLAGGAAGRLSAAQELETGRHALAAAQRQHRNALWLRVARVSGAFLIDGRPL